MQALCVWSHWNFCVWVCEKCRKISGNRQKKSVTQKVNIQQDFENILFDLWKYKSEFVPGLHLMQIHIVRNCLLWREKQYIYKKNSEVCSVSQRPFLLPLFLISTPYTPFPFAVSEDGWNCWVNVAVASLNSLSPVHRPCEQSACTSCQAKT